MRLKRNEIKI